MAFAIASSARRMAASCSAWRFASWSTGGGGADRCRSRSISAMYMAARNRTCSLVAPVASACSASSASLTYSVAQFATFGIACSTTSAACASTFASRACC